MRQPEGNRKTEDTFMLRNPLNVSISLDHIHCIDEGDGPGNAEPYLWTLFFKIDGDTLQLDASLKLRGTVTVDRRDGSHGNLQNTDVDAGDNVPIPSSIGRWSTTLTPIPLAQPISIRDETDPNRIKDTITSIPGTVGVVCILMEEDSLPDSSALAGYNAFCSTFETKMNEVVNTLGLSKQELSDDDNSAVSDAISAAVESAIGDNLNFLEAIWNWATGPDQSLGNATFKFTHDELASLGQISFNERWKEGVSVSGPIDFVIKGPGRFIESGGEWEIFGNVSAAPVPQLIGEFGPVITFSQEEMAMADFRKMAEAATREGFVGAFPNFYTASYGRSNVGGAIFLKPGCAVWRDVPLVDLGEPPLRDFAERFRATNRYATAEGFVGGFPNFFHADHLVFSSFDPTRVSIDLSGSGDDYNPRFSPYRTAPRGAGGGLAPGLNRTVVCGTVLIKPECAEWRDVPLTELGNPLLSDIGARFRGTQDYATRNGFIGGFPNFFHADYGNGVVCGTVLIKPDAAEWRDVLLWLGPA
jgi:hypothetical protein